MIKFKPLSTLCIFFCIFRFWDSKMFFMSLLVNKSFFLFFLCSFFVLFCETDQVVSADKEPRLPTSNFFQHSFISIYTHHIGCFHTTGTETAKKPILTNISFIAKLNDTYSYRGSLWSPNMMGSGESIVMQRISISCLYQCDKIVKISMSPK